MKKLLLISAIILCGVIPSLAQLASATIFSENGEKFWVVMNGVKQNSAAQTNVKITGLTEPAYKFKIIFEDETIAAMDESVMTQDVDGKPNDVTYVIKKNPKGKYVMRVTSFQPAKGNTVPENNQVSVPVHSTETAPASTGGTTTTVTHQTTTTGTNPSGGNVSIAAGDGMGGGVNLSMNISGMDAGTSGTTTTTTTTTTHSSTTSTNNSQPVENNPAPSSSNKCMRPMSAGDFANAKKAIEDQGFEENKLQVAKQVLKGNCISSAQVKETIGLFSFEKTKVDYAKFAYDRTTDQNNYYTINDAFSFSSSVTELNEYINSK